MNRKRTTDCISTISTSFGGLQYLALAACLTMALSSCAGSTSGGYMRKGDHRAMITYGQSKLDRGEGLSNYEMYGLCQAYFRIRDHRRLKACNKVLLPRLEQSGYRHDLGSRLEPDAALVEPLCWQAFAALEVGQFEKAMELSLEAQERGNRAADRHFGGAIFRLRPKVPLMLAYAHQGEIQKARALLNELQSKQSSYFTWGEENAAYLGQAYLLLGQPNDAIKVLERGHLFQDDKYRAALRKVMLAKAKKQVGQSDEARNLLAQLANDPIILESRDVLYVVLLELSELLVRQGDLASAEQYLRRAVDATEGVRATLSTEAAKIGFSRGRQAAYGLMVEVLVEQGKVREGLEYAERGKARALVDTLASKSTFASKRLSKDTSKQLLELENLKAQGKNSEPGESSSSRDRGLNLLKKKIHDAAPELASLISVETLSSSEIQSYLAADEALIEYFFHGDFQGYVFVVKRDGIEARKISTRGLKVLVGNLRASVGGRELETWRSYSRRLHTQIISPIADRLNNVKHLIIVPHGVLHYVPFNALLADQYLIEKFTIRLLPSASVFKFLDRHRTPTASLLALGNPIRKDAPPLPGTETEVRSVADLSQQAKVVLGREASEALVKRTSAAFRYLHFASHGEFDPDNPMASRLLLSAGDGEDGDLTVSEIYDLDLNADLVVLSACQTGLGKVRDGDDVVGLNRGFLYAGAKSIVASLWNVPDSPTAELMTSLYQHLKQHDLRKALQTAQIEMMSKYPHPRDWAAFQITGSGK